MRVNKIVTVVQCESCDQSKRLSSGDDHEREPGQVLGDTRFALEWQRRLATAFGYAVYAVCFSDLGGRATACVNKLEKGVHGQAEVVSLQSQRLKADLECMQAATSG